MLRIRLAGPAERDIAALLAWSGEHFGEAGRRRYAALIEAALRDVAADPERPGSQMRPELGPGRRIYHLRHSRERTPDGSVQSPRHFLVYRRAAADLVVVARILHDAMDIARHLSAEDESG